MVSTHHHAKRFTTYTTPPLTTTEAFEIACSEARLSYFQGGIPIGAVLVSSEGKLMGRGHNERVQKGSAILHVCPPPSATMTARIKTKSWT